MTENRLAGETSPYLLQHAHNPVDWNPWGPDALASAKSQNKPILLSIGYAACHWCHVMAHESFENDGIAAVMNEMTVQPTDTLPALQASLDGLGTGQALQLTNAD